MPQRGMRDEIHTKTARLMVGYRAPAVNCFGAQELVEDYEELSDFLVRSGWLKFVQPLPCMS